MFGASQQRYHARSLAIEIDGFYKPNGRVRGTAVEAAVRRLVAKTLARHYQDVFGQL